MRAESYSVVLSTFFLSFIFCRMSLEVVGDPAQEEFVDDPEPNSGTAHLLAVRLVFLWCMGPTIYLVCPDGYRRGTRTPAKPVHV